MYFCDYSNDKILETKKGPMSGYPGRIWIGYQDAPHSADILIPATYGREGGGPLQACITEPHQGNSGGPPVTHDL